MNKRKFGLLLRSNDILDSGRHFALQQARKGHLRLFLNVQRSCYSLFTSHLIAPIKSKTWSSSASVLTRKHHINNMLLGCLMTAKIYLYPMYSFIKINSVKSWIAKSTNFLWCTIFFFNFLNKTL